MFSIPTLKFEANHQSQGFVDGAGSHREALERKSSVLASEYNAKMCGLSLNTGITSVGPFTDRNYDDFTPIAVSEEEIDLPEMMVEQEEIFKNINSEIKWMFDEESKAKNKGVWKNQKRDMIVNWVALVHTKYKFDQDTFSRSVSIIDKYLSAEFNEDEDYELLAITALWMSAKIQERKLKTLKHWCKLGRNFTEDKILEMESKILSRLNYQIIYPTPEMFLR